MVVVRGGTTQEGAEDGGGEGGGAAESGEAWGVSQTPVIPLVEREEDWVRLRAGIFEYFRGGRDDGGGAGGPDCDADWRRYGWCGSRRSRSRGTWRRCRRTMGG